MDAFERAVLAIDIGGTKVSAGMVLGARLLRHEVLATPATAGPDAVLRTAVMAARSVLAGAGAAPVALGVACAGVVRRGRVHAMSPELLPGWDDFPVVDALKAELDLPTYAVNDAQAAAYGEWRHGAGAGTRSMLFVTVSTGVGGGLVLNGELWPGATGLAGHVGHMRGGEAERLASGTALARRAREAGHEGFDARRVIEEAARGSDWARAIVDEAAAALARTLLDVKLLADPELVVLGGGVGLNERFRRTLERALGELPATQRLELVPARLGAMAGLVGAAELAADHGGRRHP